MTKTRDILIESQAVRVDTDIEQSTKQPPIGVKNAAQYLFDQLTGASYYGSVFRQILREDGRARASAIRLVERLRAHGCKGMD